MLENGFVYINNRSATLRIKTEGIRDVEIQVKGLFFRPFHSPELYSAIAQLDRQGLSDIVDILHPYVARYCELEDKGKTRSEEETLELETLSGAELDTFHSHLMICVETRLSLLTELAALKAQI